MFTENGNKRKVIGQNTPYIKYKEVMLVGGRSFINGIPIEEIPEEERMEMFNRMLIKAAHSIGLRFTKEEENFPCEDRKNESNK